MHLEPTPCRPRPYRAALASAVLALAIAGTAGAAAPAEVVVRGEATFRAPADAMIAAVPAESPVAPADWRSGTLSFEIVYDESVPDADPDAWSGVYPGAIRAFRVRIGASTVVVPATGAELRVSDGGSGLAHRESLQMLGVLPIGAHTLRVGWVQLNQRGSTEDLRGAAGAIATDAIPERRTVVAFPSSGAFDRVFFVRIDPPGDPRRPVLYLSTSSLSVVAADGATR